MGSRGSKSGGRKGGGGGVGGSGDDGGASSTFSSGAVPISQAKVGDEVEINHGWGYNMLSEKVGKYGYQIDFAEYDDKGKQIGTTGGDTFKIVKQTEKAVQVHVPVYKLYGDGDTHGSEKTWDMWMPKSAFVEKSQGGVAPGNPMAAFL